MGMAEPRKVNLPSSQEQSSFNAPCAVPTCIDVGHNEQEGLAIAVWAAPNLHALQRDGDVHP